jgi:pimeloyl-ACP methyl ester carboxylesterase
MIVLAFLVFQVAAPAFGQQKILFVLGHGMPADAGETADLATAIANDASSFTGYTFTVNNTSYDYRNINTEAQAEVMGNRINDYFNDAATDPDKIILIGHSQGGLRARQYAQHTSGLPAFNKNSDPTQPDPSKKKKMRSKIAGVVTIGTPNQGTPLTTNKNWFFNEVKNTLVAAALFVPIASLALIPVVGLVIIELEKLMNQYETATLPDLAPGNSFIQKLDNVNSANCRWILVGTSSWTNICGGNNVGGQPIGDAGLIPTGAATLSLVGQNNDFDSYAGALANVSNLKDVRTGAGVAAIGIAAGFWAVSWWAWWWIPAAISWSALSAMIYNLPYRWNDAVGSPKNDSFIPEDSQRINFGDRGLVMNPSFNGTEDLKDAQHSGPKGEMRVCSLNGATGGCNFDSGAGVKIKVMLRTVLP